MLSNSLGSSSNQNLGNAGIRSFRSLKQFTSFCHNNFQQHPDIVEKSVQEEEQNWLIPNVLHLPPSIDSIEKFSPKLFYFLISKDFMKKEDLVKIKKDFFVENSYFLKVFAFNGQQIEKFPPKHLMELNEKDVVYKNSELHTSESERDFKKYGLDNGSLRAASLGRKQVQRKPVSTKEDTRSLFSLNFLPPEEKIKIPRFFLQLRTITFKSNLNLKSVFCTVKVNTQKFFTLVAPCVKETGKSGSLVATLNEADIPTEKEEFTVVVQLHSSRLPTSDSVESFQSEKESFAEKLKRTQGALKRNINGILNQPAVNVSNNGNDLLGEFSLSLPVNNHFPKITGTYNFSLNGKKELAKSLTQMGVFLDEEFNLIKPPPQKFFSNYLNFYMHTETFSYWKKYWCVIQKGFLIIYDFEYKETKDPIGYIPFHAIRRVGSPSQEVMCSGNTLEIEVSRSKFLPKNNNQKDSSLLRGKKKEELTSEEFEMLWKESLCENAIKHRGSDIGPLVIYCMAEGEEGLQLWKKEFDLTLSKIVPKLPTRK
ncbi:hypothetical protein HK099_001695 [Clydaea vesicula]|uniref:PH domain-containing protein n=1 Tax=Clydaea vesicula TaxID=447962 RepID=A0AAD5TU19_9FUNG|nr:hypothetical protein HK099_001695 [Clydaea vesicula]